MRGTATMLHQIVNQYAKSYRPYMGGFINQLPMAQLALYEMTGDIERVIDYSTYFIDHFSIDPIKSSYPTMTTIDACVGKREAYESCLDLVRAEIAAWGVDEAVKQVLSNYPLGISSSVFHVLIRLGYAVKGYQMEMESTQEVARALAYYLTAYREAKTFEGSASQDVHTIKLVYSCHVLSKLNQADGLKAGALNKIY